MGGVPQTTENRPSATPSRCPSQPGDVPRGAGEPRGSGSYLGIKIDRDQFGLWVPPDERLSEVVLGFF